MIFDTVKGRGVSFMEHNRVPRAPPSPEQFEQALAELGAAPPEAQS